MPIYSYRCTECGAEEEHLQKVSDPPVENCSACGGKLVKRITGTNFKLVGGGWYKDLYASSKPSDKGGSKGSKGASSSSGDAGSKAANG